MEVFVVMAESGEYEDRWRWITAVYLDLSAAEAAVSVKRAEIEPARQFLKEHQAKFWPLCRQAAKGWAGTLADGELQKIEAEIGPYPDGPEADRYDIVRVEVGVWGSHEEC